MQETVSTVLVFGQAYEVIDTTATANRKTHKARNDRSLLKQLFVLIFPQHLQSVVDQGRVYHFVHFDRILDGANLYPVVLNLA